MNGGKKTDSVYRCRYLVYLFTDVTKKTTRIRGRPIRQLNLMVMTDRLISNVPLRPTTVYIILRDFIKFNTLKVQSTFFYLAVLSTMRSMDLVPVYWNTDHEVSMG
jgi:hypothetical protein